MRLLYNTLTERLQPYPRDDDEDVVGLSPEYLPMQVINEDRPEIDPQTHRLQAHQTIDLDAQTVTNGWMVETITPVSTVPLFVSMRSLRLALIDANLYQVVVTAINSIPDDKEKLKAQIWWTTSATVRRDNSYVLTIGAAVGKMPEEIDQIFKAAAILDLTQ